MALARAFLVKLRQDPTMGGVAVGDTMVTDESGNMRLSLMVCMDSEDEESGGQICTIPITELVCVDPFEEFNEEEADEDNRDEDDDLKNGEPQNETDEDE